MIKDGRQKIFTTLASLTSQETIEEHRYQRLS